MSSFLWLLLYLAPLLGLTAALFGWFGWHWRGSDLLKSIQDLTAKLEEAQKALRTAEAEAQAATAAEPTPQQAPNTTEQQALHDDLKAAQNEIRLQQDAAAKAREAARALETESARLLSDLEHLRAAQSSTQSELATAKVELAASRAEHTAAQQALATAEAELTQLRSVPPAAAPEPQAKRKRSPAAKPKAAAPAANLGEKIAALENQLSAQQASLTTLTQERDDCQHRIRSLEEKTPPDAAGLRQARRSLADSEKRLAAATAEVDSLQTQTRVLRRIEESAAVSSSVPDDDLTQIKGIKKVISEQLYSHGIRTWRQIALWNEEELRAFSELLAFKNRATREQWQEQARALHEAAYGPLT
ncbi:hypothetical protein [Prosthecobacter vanneervenii]|uniref:Putative flap endonuclease-1-like 5' DNA nuclease n=1 Tax=Prosthecobacter vanneervenii TaxID=48466 RepID=A0A7W7YC62_9BACT|nr:hypothetical protein [Prosthecobacter vanneervenii]MBB5033414.1 putative flap endonuclease-1-like 5' DNA nuclease [Prosthecobacter vanneervenii]